MYFETTLLCNLHIVKHFLGVNKNVTSEGEFGVIVQCYKKLDESRHCEPRRFLAGRSLPCRQAGNLKKRLPCTTQNDFVIFRVQGMNPTRQSEWFMVVRVSSEPNIQKFILTVRSFISFS